MQIPILNGIYTDGNSDFRTAYPRNMVPVPKSQGISEGYLKPAEGIREVCDLPGRDRGGIVWNGVHYRCAGDVFLSVSATGVITEHGNVADKGDRVKLDYSFDRLSICAGGRLYYWNGSVLSEVVDIDLGYAKDTLWIDGYFAITDGESVIVTELNDPASINPLKYGSSEVDPDPVVGLQEIRNEMYAVNRHSIEAFQNVGGTGFPWSRIDGAHIPRGAISRDCSCVYLDRLAFVGGGRNEPPAVWLGANGDAQKISTREIEQVIKAYPESVIASDFLIETRYADAHEFLLIHTPDRTLVYDAAASTAVQEPAWHILTSGVNSRYRARGLTYFNDVFYAGDSVGNKLGVLDDKEGAHYGDICDWEFSTPIIYNESMGAVIHELELVALTGRSAFGSKPVIMTDYSLDGVTYSTPRACSAGAQGDRSRRIKWLGLGILQYMRMQRFRGTSADRVAVARLEARVEALNV